MALAVWGRLELELAAGFGWTPAAIDPLPLSQLAYWHDGLRELRTR